MHPLQELWGLKKQVGLELVLDFFTVILFSLSFY